MPDPHWENLKEIFHAAVTLPANERAAYLDRACDSDASLRQAVESLIKSHEQTGFVDQPAYRAAADMFVDDSTLKPGQTVAHYKILSLLGEGGMGKVYLAEDTKLRRRVAIKFLPGASNANEDANRRLLREARAAAKLEHPNICAVYEVGEENGRGFIVMPHLQGETLHIRMKGKPLDVSESLALAAQVADALAEAHEHGIIHRDIKPSNIIITPRGQAKVMDFGLAKAASGPAATGIEAEASTQALLTTPGTIIGTVPYMSPEQVHGQPLDARTDIFSFGIVLYGMLTGQHLFAAETPAGTISAILTKEPAPLSEYFQTCPQELQCIVSKCLEKDRERRYQTMRDIVTDLENVRGEYVDRLLVTAKRETAVSSKDTASKIDTHRSSFITWRTTLLLAGLVAIAILVYAGFLISSRNPPTTNAKSVNSLAYDYYLRGKVNSRSQNRENNATAIKLLEQAVKIDSGFAPAYTELARAYIIKSWYFVPEAESKQLNVEAEVAVEKALALDPNLADAHSARGFILWTHVKGFPHEQAIQAYQRALSLDPNQEEAHHQLGTIYFHIGLLDKSWAEIDKGLAINPANTLVRFRYGVINIYRGKYEEAITLFKSIPREANPSLVDRNMATALLQLGRMDEASAVVEEYLRIYPDDEGGAMTSVKAMLFAHAGKRRETEEIIQRAIEIGKGFGHFHHTAYNIASAYALLNQPAEAVKWLQSAADDGFPCYPWFEKDANLNNLRKGEQFITFMAKQKQQWEKYKSTL